MTMLKPATALLIERLMNSLANELVENINSQVYQGLAVYIHRCSSAAWVNIPKINKEKHTWL